MEKRELLDLLINSSDDKSRIDAARLLSNFVHDRGVLSLLCSAAVEAISDQLRDALIKTLELKQEEANRWFTDCAIHSPIPAQRSRALIALSLTECQTAKEAIIRGLRDPNRSVRIGAALNAGLYHDKDVLKALENYFEKKPLDFVWQSFADTMKKVRTKRKKLDKSTNDTMGYKRVLSESTFSK